MAILATLVGNRYPYFNTTLARLMDFNLSKDTNKYLCENWASIAGILHNIMCLLILFNYVIKVLDE